MKIISTQTADSPTAEGEVQTPPMNTAEEMPPPAPPASPVRRGLQRIEERDEEPEVFEDASEDGEVQLRREPVHHRRPIP